MEIVHHDDPAPGISTAATIPPPSQPPTTPSLPTLSRPPTTPKPVTRGPSTRGLSDELRLNICRDLLQGTPVKIIAAQRNCTIKNVYTVAHNLRTYGSVRKPIDANGEVKALGRPSKLSDADAEALFEELVRSGWMEQHEMVKWLRTERGIEVSQSTMSRFLKQRKWSEKSLRAYCLTRSEGENERRRGGGRKRKGEGAGSEENMDNNRNVEHSRSIEHTGNMEHTRNMVHTRNMEHTGNMESIRNVGNAGYMVNTANTVTAGGGPYYMAPPT